MNHMMSVAIDLTPILPGGENGGAKILVIELITHLTIMAPNINFLLLTHERSHEELRFLDCQNAKRICVMPSSFDVSGKTIFKRLINKIKHFVFIKKKQRFALLKVDLLFCPFSAPTYHQDGIPTICTILDLQYKTYPEFFTKKDLRSRHKTFINACAKASKLVTISEYTKATVIQHSNFDSRQIKTIYPRMAQRTKDLDHTNTHILKQFNIGPQQYILYPANFWKHKNHQSLFIAFAKAKKQLNSNIKLVCTGAANAHQTWLIKKTKDLQVENDIVFTGFVSPIQVTTLLVNAKGMIFPSLYEGFGIPIVEAFAHGIPVACSNLTALPEIAKDAAILFNPKDVEEITQAIIRLCTLSPAAKNHLSALGYKRAENFSQAAQMAIEYIDIFQECIRHFAPQYFLDKM